MIIDSGIGTGSMQVTGSFSVLGESKFGIPLTTVYRLLVETSISGSVTGSLFGTSSWARNALTSSFVTSSNVWGPFGSGSVTSASFSVSSSTATSSSLALTASSVNVLNQGVVISGSLTVFTGSGVEFQVTNTGVNIGNVIGDRHNITGSVNISGSLLVNGSPAGTGAGGASVTISGSAPSGSNPSGSLWWNSNDGNLYIQVTSPTGSTYVPATNTVAGGEYGATFRQGYTGSTWTVNHNLGTTTPLVNVYSGSAVMIPASIISTNANTTTISFSGSVQGTAVVSTGIGGPTSSSFALSAVTASYALNSPAGGAPVYAVLTRNSTQAGVTSATDLNWDNISTNGSITQPSGSGTAFVRVPAGIYRITAKLGFTGFTSGANGLLYVRLVDTSNNILPLSVESFFADTTYSSTSSSTNDAIEGILVATAPFSFKVRCTTAAGSATLRNEYAILIIQSL